MFCLLDSQSQPSRASLQSRANTDLCLLPESSLQRLMQLNEEIERKLAAPTPSLVHVSHFSAPALAKPALSSEAAGGMAPPPSAVDSAADFTLQSGPAATHKKLAAAAAAPLPALADTADWPGGLGARAPSAPQASELPAATTAQQQRSIYAPEMSAGPDRRSPIPSGYAWDRVSKPATPRQMSVAPTPGGEENGGPFQVSSPGRFELLEHHLHVPASSPPVLPQHLPRQPAIQLPPPLARTLDLRHRTDRAGSEWRNATRRRVGARVVAERNPEGQ
jgi:hypothetical protein